MVVPEGGFCVHSIGIARAGQWGQCQGQTGKGLERAGRPSITAGSLRREHGDAGDHQPTAVEGLHHARTAHTRKSPAMHLQPAMEVEERPDAVYSPGSLCSYHLAAASEPASTAAPEGLHRSNAPQR